MADDADMAAHADEAVTDAGERRFTFAELCVLVDLPRRTVRFYQQTGVTEAAAGLGRGAHYTRRHVEQLLTVKRLREAGLSLERIRELVVGDPAPVAFRPPRPGHVEVWSRVLLADGVEVQIEPQRAGLSPEQVRALVRAIGQCYEAVCRGPAATGVQTVGPPTEGDMP